MQWNPKRCAFFVVCTIFLASCEKSPNRSGAAHDDTTLWTAASRGDMPQVERMVRYGAPINGTDKSGMTPLHYAAQSKNLQLVRFLIQHGADVNAKADENVTPLYLSLDMAFGQPEISLELIKSGADVSVADNKVGDTPLLIAATESSYEVMQALLRKGANPNTKNHYGETPLHYAALNALVDRVQLLLQYGADPTIRDLSGKSAIDVVQTTNPDATVRKHFEETRNVLLAASRQQRK
jgi:ankyrin repeat protein